LNFKLTETVIISSITHSLMKNFVCITTALLFMLTTGIPVAWSQGLNTGIQYGNSSIINSASQDTFLAQKTEMSMPASASVTPHGKLPHQIVFALPLRNDSKIWTGILTFSASKPIEIEVLHEYNPDRAIGSEHGEPYHATLANNMTVAISTMTMFTDTPVRVTDSPISTGSLSFTGSAILFHKTSGEPFTVTYTVDAVAKQLNQ
jgi:hypothetical protein